MITCDTVTPASHRTTRQRGRKRERESNALHLLFRPLECCAQSVPWFQNSGKPLLALSYWYSLSSRAGIRTQARWKHEQRGVGSEFQRTFRAPTGGWEMFPSSDDLLGAEICSTNETEISQPELKLLPCRHVCRLARSWVFARKFFALLSKKKTLFKLVF